MHYRHVVAALVIAAVAAPATARAQSASATLTDPDGQTVATATFEATEAGVLVTLEASALPEGVHGFHIHAVGACDAPEFQSAGGHYNPADTPHGLLVDGGPHAGDMANIHVPASGALTVEVLNPGVSLDPADAATLFDADGSALMVHAGADDYTSQPSGDAGSRIACGVIESR